VETTSSLPHFKESCTPFVTHHQFNIQQLYALPTLYLCVLYLSENTFSQYNLLYVFYTYILLYLTSNSNSYAASCQAVLPLSFVRNRILYFNSSLVSFPSAYFHIFFITSTLPLYATTCQRVLP